MWFVFVLTVILTSLTQCSLTLQHVNRNVGQYNSFLISIEPLKTTSKNVSDKGASWFECQVVFLSISQSLRNIDMQVTLESNDRVEMCQQVAGSFNCSDSVLKYINSTCFSWRFSVNKYKSESHDLICSVTVSNQTFSNHLTSNIYSSVQILPKLHLTPNLDDETLQYNLVYSFLCNMNNANNIWIVTLSLKLGSKVILQAAGNGTASLPKFRLDRSHKQAHLLCEAKSGDQLEPVTQRWNFTKTAFILSFVWFGVPSETMEGGKGDEYTPL